MSTAPNALARAGDVAEPPDPRRWQALAVVCAAFFMTVLDVSVVNVALPSIQDALHFSAENLQWVVTAYAVTFGGFLLLGGRAADLLGRRRVFMAGIVLFTLASFACGLATSEGTLIAARAVQGLGAAVISPAALSIVSTTFTEGAERNKALGIWGAVGGSGAAVGVLAGGLLTRYLGWEWIFFVNVPVGLLALALARPIVRESRAEGVDRRVDPDYVEFWRPWSRYFSYNLSSDARHRRLAGELRTRGLSVIDLRDSLKGVAGTYRLTDGHWTEKGTDIVAQQLSNGLVDFRKRSMASGKGL